MESRTYQLLEFPKVLRELAKFAVSEPGRQACLDIEPFEEFDALQIQTELLDETISWFAETGFRLSSFPPLDGLLAAVQAPEHVLDLDDFVAVREVLAMAKPVLDEAGGDERRPRLAGLATGVAWPGQVWSAIKRCLSQDGRLKDESSPELFDVRERIRRIHQRCSSKVRDFLENERITDFLQEEYVTISSDRYVLPLQTNFKGRVQGIIHDYSQTGETCYFEPYFLVELNNELQGHKRQEREEERKVLAYLTSLVRSGEDGLTGVYDFLVRLDRLQAKSDFAARLDARPLFMGQGEDIHLPGARHPILALAEGECRPLDIRLDEDEYALIISGGNAGGKTVCLKTLGLASLMAQSAIPVTVEAGARLPFWRAIHVFLGDEQSLEEHLSTFTAQIRSVSRAFDDIGPGALVILDEFGAGTDPSQGAALAQALIDALVDRRARTVAATHFPALKAYGLTRDHVRAASMIFDPDTQRPLYRLAYGQIGASIALEVAKEHGLPAEILERAEEYLLLEGKESTSVMERLNELAAAREEEIEKLEQDRRRLKQRQEQLERELAEEKERLAGDIKAEARSIVRQWQKDKIGRKEATRKLAELRGNLERAPEPERPAQKLAWEDLETGLAVEYLPWKKTGTVIETNERKHQVKVDMNGVTMWVDFDGLARAGEGEAKPSPKPKAKVESGPSRGAVVDLRGQRSDAAVSELSRFLDQLLLQGRDHAEVIHGRGSGALRREVHEFLRTFPAVKSFNLAPEDEGGDGKTLVELK